MYNVLYGADEGYEAKMSFIYLLIDFAKDLVSSYSPILINVAVTPCDILTFYRPLATLVAFVNKYT